MNYAYLNGKIIKADKIKIEPYDIGFLRGYGVFDVMCTQNGKPFLFNDHWKRFLNSAKELGLHVPITKEKYEAAIKKLLRSNGFEKSNIRTVLTGGMSPNGFSYKPGNETFLILIEKFNPLTPGVFKKGAKVITLEYQRQIPRAKVINYVTAIKNQKVKERAGALEIIYTQGGQALEASTSNFFIVKNGEIITTKDNILIGITRKLIIQLAKGNGFKVAERPVSIKELFSADEAFLTATNKDIVPIVKIDGKKIRNSEVGPITKFLIQEFNKFTKNY